MKYLILFLLPFSVYAKQYCVRVKTNYNPDYVEVKNDNFKSMEVVEKWVNKQVREKSWGKPERWLAETAFTYEKKVDAIDQREECGELDQMCTTLYKFPKDFDYEILDCTSEYSAKEQAKIDRKNEINQIKNSINLIQKSSLEQWHKTLLIRLVKELK